jgi:hypothetical protein
MFVGSNYLDHHWLWDGLAGVSLACASVWLSGKLLGTRHPVPAPPGAMLGAS